MSLKKIFCGMLYSAFALCMLSGCYPEIMAPDFSIDDIYGKWRSGTEYYVYEYGGTGYTWDESDDVYEDEAQRFTWEVDENEMIHIHKTEMGFDDPMYYIITELTASTLKYYDAYNRFDTYSFTKVY